MTKSDSAQPERAAGAGLLMSVAAVLAVTIASVAAGLSLAWYANTKGAAASAPKASETRAAARVEPQLVVKPVPTVLTKLAGNPAPWLRLNLSIVVPKNMPEQDRFVEVIAQDTLTFVSTLTSAEVTGPTSLDLLKADLQEIVRLRSNGAAVEIFIRGLLME